MNALTLAGAIKVIPFERLKAMSLLSVRSAHPPPLSTSHLLSAKSRYHLERKEKRMRFSIE